MGPKISSKCAKIGVPRKISKKRRFWTPFGGHFGTILASFWGPLGTFWEAVRTLFESMGAFWDLGDFLHLFGVISQIC